jgi:integrase
MAGNITKRTANDGSVSYRVRVEIPTGVDGKRRQASKTYRTRKEAERALAAWLVEIDRGTAIEPSTVTVGELLELWLRDEAAHRVRPSTLEDYALTIHKHIMPAIGSVTAQKLQPTTVQTFYSDKLAAGTGARTVQLCHLRLSQALKWAVRMGIVGRNVVELVKPPTAASRTPTVWTPEQAHRFLDHAGDDWRPLFDLMLATGVRRGEALGLRWSDVDVEAGTIQIRQSVGILHGQPSVSEPKTRSAQRAIPLPVETVAMLRKHRIRQNEHRLKFGPLWEDRDLVFPNAFGGYLHPCNVDRAFQRIIRTAGVPRLRIHDLRHTYATWALSAGEPPTDVSRILGHARVSITMDIYSHAIPNKRERVSSTIGSLLYRRSG